MKKAKKILSLVLVAALVVSVCLMGGLLNASAAATVIDEGNLLLNGSFETASTIWNNNISKGGRDGFTGGKIGNGQDNAVLDYWRGYGHYYEENKVTLEDRVIYIDHTDDAYSGSLALKFYNSGYTGDYQSETVIYPNGYTKVAEDFATGNYRLSFMVKGTNTASSVTVVDASGKEHTVELDAAEGYNDATYSMVVVDNLSGIATTTQNNKTVLNIKIRIKSEKNQATEIYIDDARLEEVPVVVDPNLIVDGGFENSSFSGYASHNEGQIPFEKGEFWAYQTWIRDIITVEDTTDTHSGSLAVKVSTTSTTNDWFRFWMTPKNLNTNNLVAGTYKVTAWVKGTNTDACIQELDSEGKTVVQSVNVPASAANGWIKITLNNITINSVDDLYLVGTGNGDNRYRYNKIRFHVKNAADKYVIFDDVRFEKVEETKEVLTNTSFEKFTCDVDVVHKPGQGQRNTVATGWYNSEHWGTAKEGNLATITHDTDAKSGNYALKFSFPKKGKEVSLITDTVNGDITKISGAYVLSFWVKGDGTTVSVRNRNTSTNKYETIKTETVTGEWTQISAVISNVNYWNVMYNNKDTDKRDTLTAEIRVAGSTEKEAYALVDDISLMPLDTVEDVATQITGIKQPAVGATKLELPVLDTNNDAITVSIAASSDEKVIALDGTITTPKTKKVVDITLKVTDGTNEVILDPIGVLVQGELDGVTEGEMAEAIRGLDVKAETAAADIEQIEYWLEYRGGMVTKDNKNLFAQKKLVFEFDKSGDTVLDKDDIVAVREELLGENTKDYTIRDLVKTFNKVVEYNSFAQ